MGSRTVPSLAELVEETLGLLNDWTGQQAQQCTLTSELTLGGLTLFVDDIDAVGRGLVEVDEELVYVSTVDPTAGTASIPAWGRGQQGSTVAAHAVGARVTTAPRPPRHRVKARINRAITGLFPDLWAVGTLEVPADDRAEYELPAAARFILDVQWQTVGLPVEWARVRSWRLNTQADPTDFPSGVAAAIPGVPIGETLRIVYAAAPVELVNPGDDFAAVTGLPAGAADLPVLAAAAFLALGQELSRAQLATVEQQQRAEKISTGASMAASRMLRQEYTIRLASERRRLLATYPSRPHFEGI
jgi:hypothetical protein